MSTLVLPPNRIILAAGEGLPAAAEVVGPDIWPDPDILEPMTSYGSSGTGVWDVVSNQYRYTSHLVSGNATDAFIWPDDTYAGNPLFDNFPAAFSDGDHVRAILDVVVDQDTGTGAAAQLDVWARADENSGRQDAVTGEMTFDILVTDAYNPVYESPFFLEAIRHKLGGKTLMHVTNITFHVIT